MVFMCQVDSYLTNFSSTVTSCEPTESKVENKNGQLVKTDGYHVELDDTILFPEGGGQPDDRGTINNVPVMKISRKGAKAIHFVGKKFEVGETVKLSVDWDRRFDHMQQHSAQHLITAIADGRYGYKTTSWNLGKEISFIELDVPQTNQDNINNIESQVNKAILENVPVVVHVTHVGSPLLESVRTRGLPDDHVGDVRIVEIKGIEANMCCGTHVSNLSHLQCIKILGTEKGKKGKTNLYFLAGSRVLSYAGKCYASEKELTKHLKCSPDQHVHAVDRTIKQLKLYQKNCTSLLRDIAVLEASKFKSSAVNKCFCLHRKEGNIEFMNIIANEIGLSAFLFLTVGDEKGVGMFLLSGPEGFVQSCGSKIMELIGGKGLAKGNRMQGKAEKLQKKQQAITIIDEFMSKFSSLS
ncbi:unnamed protein product [Clavelina lepadiformis]|uniref:Alanyl-transfer RNA synthetases family profile domain-containing protein n=1 Tax=Clavelina lepadiformis TaxID=159417 RepID=A0ABP0GX32_CLALP